MRTLDLHRETGRRLGGRGGQAAIIATLTLTFLFGAVGFAWDLGWDYFMKNRVQTAADSAAAAAAVYALNVGDACSPTGTVACGVSYTCAGAPANNSLEAGCLYATSDGPPAFTATMIENDSAHPPPGLTHNAPTMWVQATVTSTSNHLFLYLSGFHSSSILATSIAGTHTIPAGACIYVLSPSASKALTLTGTSSITTSSCGVYDNSNASDALYMNGSPYLGATGGGQILVHGHTSISVGGHGLPDPNPNPVVNSGPISDPLASLPAPSFSTTTCDHTGYSKNHSQTDAITHGVFCGGISVTGDASVTLGPGIYILNGGGLTVGNSASLSGTGVMFYLTATSGETPGPVSITGNGVVSLTAASTGTYQGIAFFQDKNASYSGTNTISNSGTGLISGTYYFPSTAFSFTGNTGTTVNSAFVALTMTLAGSCTLQNDSTGSLTGLARASAQMVQ